MQNLIGGGMCEGVLKRERKSLSGEMTLSAIEGKISLARFGWKSTFGTCFYMRVSLNVRLTSRQLCIISWN